MDEMKIELWKKPKNPIIIEGFPGFGLIGTITTEFLIDQLKAELIGTIRCDDIPAMIAIHAGKVVQPIGLFYDKKTNIIIVHIITSIQGIEWRLADAIVDLAKRVQATRILSLEGVASPMSIGEPKCYFFCSNKDAKHTFEKNNIEELKEGIILGVTGALLLQADGVPVSCIFAETHSKLPDSKAAASIITILDKILDLKIDPGPLMQQAQKFESKIKGLLEKSQEVADLQEKKRMSYVG